MVLAPGTPLPHGSVKNYRQGTYEELNSARVCSLRLSKDVAQTFLSAAPRFFSAFLRQGKGSESKPLARFDNQQRPPRRISALQTRMSAPQGPFVLILQVLVWSARADRHYFTDRKGAGGLARETHRFLA